MLLQPSASYSFILRTETSDRPGTLGRVTTAIGEEGGDIGAIDIVRVGGGRMVRDLTVAARDEAHAETIVERVRDRRPGDPRRCPSERRGAQNQTARVIAQAARTD